MRRPLGLHLALMITATLALIGCNSDDPAQLRMLNVSAAYDSLDLYVAAPDESDRLEIASVSSETVSAYSALKNATYTIKVRRSGAAGTLTTLYEEHLYGNSYTTLIAYGSVGRFSALRLDEDRAEPDAGKTRVQVINVAEAGSLDVYITEDWASLDDQSAQVRSIGSGSQSGFFEIDSDTYRVRITSSGDANDLRLDIPEVEFGSEAVVSLILSATAQGGVLINAILLPQQGEPTVFRNTKARVRGAHAVSSGTSVTARINGTALMSNATPGIVSQYRQIDAGTASVQLTVDGEPIAVANQTLAAGADYTLLAWNDADGVHATLLDDDNSAPGSSGKAKLRLINGISGFGGPINLSIDFVPIAEGIPLGEVSGYSEVDSGSDIQLDVISSSTAARLWTRDETSLQSGGIYTLLMTGRDADTVSGTLRQDR